jgi:uncharacterized protein (TIGR01777 family)
VATNGYLKTPPAAKDSWPRSVGNGRRLASQPPMPAFAWSIFERMLGPFRLGLGGRIGSGRQYWPWIAIDDAISVIEFCLTRPDLAGPVNVVAPEAITNRQFTKALGRVLRRPTLLPMPGFAARLALGQMAGPLLLASVRADPTRLRQVGFEFEFAGLESALRHVLER